MDCPQCNQKMTAGTAQVRGSFWTFLLVGFSLQDLWFDWRDGSECALPSRQKRTAYRCEDCGGLFVPTRESSATRLVDERTGVVTEYR